MELKAKVNFTDKHTNKDYTKNDIIKVDEKRAKEMLNSPYDVVEVVKKENNKENKTSTEK
jgi:hypothetical protein